MQKHLSAIFCFFLVLLLLSPLTLFADSADETPTAQSKSSELRVADLSHAGAVYFYCIDTETVLRTQNESTPVSPDAAVKLMTSLVVYEKASDLSTRVTVTSEMVEGIQGTYYGFEKGDVVSYEDLIKIMLLRKSNDAAQILAISLFGSTDACVEAMNQKAALLGMENTHFTNVSGYYDAEMTTTAADLLPLALSFYSIPTLLEWSGSGSLYCDSIDRTIYNNNYFLSRYYNGTGNNYLDDSVGGMINGSSDKAGETLITSAKVNGYSYIVIMLGARSVDDEITCYTATLDLLEYDSANFAYTKVLRDADAVCELPVSLGQGVDYAPVFAAETLICYLPINLDQSKITKEYTLDSETLEAPVEEGMKVGSIRVFYDGELLGETDLIIRTGIARSGASYRLSQASKFLTSTGFIRTALIVIGLVALYFILNAVYLEQVKKKYHPPAK